MSNEMLNKYLLNGDNGAMLSVSQLEQLERDLIALLYSIWRLTGKSKKIVKVKEQATHGPT